MVFAWRGGEPTLLGVEFFERGPVAAVRGGAHGAERVSDQRGSRSTTRGVSSRNGALSRGPERGWSRSAATSTAWTRRGSRPGIVMRGLEVLRRHGVEFNTLTVVHRGNVRHPLEVYRFLQEIGSRHLQFIPWSNAFRMQRPRGDSPCAPPPHPDGDECG